MVHEHVAHVEPATAQVLRAAGVRIPVAAEQRGSAQRHLAGLIEADLVALVIDQARAAKARHALAQVLRHLAGANSAADAGGSPVSVEPKLLR
jgi:ribosome-interacting GTPase 1